MKFSIRGQMGIVDEAPIIDVLNTYTLWKLEQGRSVDITNNSEYFTFEAWVNTLDEKTALFEELKPFVDQYGEEITWHECTHDEANPSSCELAEVYRGV